MLYMLHIIAQMYIQKRNTENAGELWRTMGRPHAQQ